MKEAHRLGRSRRAVIADALRQEILTGVLKPGQAITLNDLSERFDVSVTPVREAVLALSDEGLVAMQTRKGIRIAELKVTDIEDVFTVYSSVAGIMAERAATRVSQADLDKLHAILQEEAEETDPDRLEEINWNFHAILNRRADYILLRSFARVLSRSIPKTYFFTIPEWREVSYGDHKAILRAVRTGDASGSRLLAEEHVRKGGEMLTRYLSRMGYWHLSDSLVAAAARKAG
ncbi:MAG TPA: GntR family transcriptional regulator [Dehalococcoidia bacterium]|jgi:DNA-binding GntR family transcriptional regulator